MSDRAPDPGPDAPTPPELRFLKLLVTVLTAVMIAGLLTIVALLVIRLGPAPVRPLPVLPERVVLPDGIEMQALTIAQDWVVVVSETGEVLLYDRASGQLEQRITPDQPRD